MLNYQSILKQLPLWKGQKIHIERLYGGGTNDNFLVTVGKNKYVARFQGESQSKFLGLDRNREIHNTKIAHSLGIGPEVIAYYPKHGLLLVRYFEGKVLKPSELRKEVMIRKMVCILKRLHTGPMFNGKFSVVKSIEYFWRIIRQDRAKLPEFGKMEQKKYKQCVKIISKRKTQLVPCHVDLVSINIIRKNQTLRIIDWDYSAMADPLFELAFMSGWSAFSPTNNHLLLTLYFGFINQQLEKEFNAVKLLFHLREAVWARVQLGRSTVPFNYRKYLNRHLNSFKGTPLLIDTK